MRTDTVTDYLHPRIVGNTVILSNTPEPVPVEPSLEEIREDKLTEINAGCDVTIAAGCGVKLSDGTAGHISLTLPDQINLSTAQAAILSGLLACFVGTAYFLLGVS